MDKVFKEIVSTVFKEKFKPYGWKKDGNNFRYISNDGLGKIINFQRSKWNTAEEIVFYINYGIYMEVEDVLTNMKFKEYECQFRNRTQYNKGEYLIDFTIETNDILKQVELALNEASMVLDMIDSKEKFIEMIINGEAGKYTNIPVDHYYTCRLLCDMGYYREVGRIIADKDGSYFDQLRDEIEKHIECEG